KDGVAVGGDYKEPDKSEAVAAFTHDGGKTWQLAQHQPGGDRSGADAVGGLFVAVGTSGIDSRSTGEGWHPLWKGGLNAISFAHLTSGWAVGPEGTILHLRMMPKGMTDH